MGTWQKEEPEMWSTEGKGAGLDGIRRPCSLLQLRPGPTLWALGGWDITQLQSERGRRLAAAAVVIYRRDLVTVYT